MSEDYKRGYIDALEQVKKLQDMTFVSDLEITKAPNFSECFLFFVIALQTFCDKKIERIRE